MWVSMFVESPCTYSCIHKSLGSIRILTYKIHVSRTSSLQFVFARAGRVCWYTYYNNNIRGKRCTILHSLMLHAQIYKTI